MTCSPGFRYFEIAGRTAKTTQSQLALSRKGDLQEENLNRTVEDEDSKSM
jgi:hypothetical protein